MRLKQATLSSVNANVMFDQALERCREALQLRYKLFQKGAKVRPPVVCSPLVTSTRRLCGDVRLLSPRPAPFSLPKA